MIVMDTFAYVSGGEVIHCTTTLYFGIFLCPLKDFGVSQFFIIISTLSLLKYIPEHAFYFICMCHSLGYFTGVLVGNFHCVTVVDTVAKIGIS